MEEAYISDPGKVTNYQIGRDDRDSTRTRRPGGFRRGRGRDYRDLDDPEVNQNEKTTAKSINFLDIWSAKFKLQIFVYLFNLFLLLRLDCMSENLLTHLR